MPFLPKTIRLIGRKDDDSGNRIPKFLSETVPHPLT